MMSVAASCNLNIAVKEEGEVVVVTLEETNSVEGRNLYRMAKVELDEQVEVVEADEQQGLSDTRIECIDQYPMEHLYLRADLRLDVATDQNLGILGRVDQAHIADD